MTESHHRTVRTFNPGTFQSDAEIIEQFVVRERELAIVLEVLRGNVDADSCQHTLIVAPRGRGKTMLLARVAAELRTDVELSTRLLPIRFMEESHEIFSAADFWLDVLFYLSLETRMQDAELARNLRDTHADLTTRWRERELDERARTAVLDVADRLGKRLVLMVENLQALCDNVDADFGWKLRKTLQMEPQIILLASATSRFEGLDDAQDPFFELFRIISLQPLETEQCRRLWQAVSGDAVSARRIRALEILTGGDPRLLVLVAEFARHRSIRQLMEHLAKLIDDHTEYFRGHLEAIGKTERRVYLALIDLWQPSTAGEIATRARMDIRPVSTMLGRLAHRGAVIIRPSARQRLYSAAQPLYSIYYKLRRERDDAAVVQGLLQFMTDFYTASEFTTIFEKLVLDARDSRKLFDGLDRARERIPLVGQLLASRTWLGTEDLASDEKRQRSGTSDVQGIRANIRELREKGAEHQRLGDHAAAVSTYDNILSRREEHTSTELLVAAAEALVNKGLAQARLDERTLAIATYDHVVKRFSASDVPALQVQVASAMINKGVAQGHDGQHAAAIATCEAVDSRYRLSDNPVLQAQTACALVNKTVVLEQLGKHTAVIATCDELEARYGTSAATPIQEQVARALFNKGFAEEQFGIFSAATATYSELIERYGHSDVLELRVQVAAALNRLGAMRARAGEHEASIATCEEIVERNNDTDAPQLQEQVGRALINKGAQQVELGKHAEATGTLDEVSALYGRSDEVELKVCVAQSFALKAVTQDRIGNRNAALMALEEVVKRFGACKDAQLQLHVADALARKGALLCGLGRHHEAAAAIEVLLERYGNSDDPVVRELVGQAMNMKGASHALLSDTSATIETSDSIIDRFGPSLEPEVQVQVAVALFFKGMAQIMTGRVEEAVETADELDRRSLTAADHGSHAFRWRARHLRMSSLLAQGNQTSAVDAFCSLYSEFLADNETMVPELVDAAAMLVAGGVPEREIIAILQSEPQKTAMMAPLIVALRQHGGETVRAPAEVLEVASDVGKRIAETGLSQPSTIAEKPV